MRILVIGSGAREHALCWKIASSPLVKEVFCAPGNAGTSTRAVNVNIPATNSGALALWAIENSIDLTVVGPEEPLSRGIVDVFQEHGLKIVGPGKAGARLEASKSFAKEVMIRAGVRTPAGAVFTDFESAKAYIIQQGAPIVVKADGLAAGKGVVVASTIEEAISTIEAFMLRERFGESSQTVVIEEMIQGQEASLIALVDGEHVLPLVPSQDYKRLSDRDEGPNTGGMGAISPTPVLSNHRLENLVGEIFVPVISELRARGIRYRGFLYAGVMIDSSGNAHVLEFNCRLGDPETEVLMMRLQSDIVPALLATASGGLSSIELAWRSESAACVVIASKGYPEAPEDGKVIHGLFAPEPDLIVFHAGTTKNAEKKDADEIVTHGGRILAVVAIGATQNQAVRRVYEGCDRISFEGMHLRRDIGGGRW